MPSTRLSLAAVLLVISVAVPAVFATVTPYLAQSWFFDWTTDGDPVPIVAQCDTLPITWSRSSATGPNPVAPYSLLIYSSAFIVPFTVPAGSGQSFNWPVPFIPGTQFQICMFDSNGNTGGCQRQMTVYPSNVSNPTCTNVTFPTSAMNVVATQDTGPLSQYGWPDQCTDISVTPKNGTPPYTLTIAPALHPPYNITVDAVTAINWTISLNWGQPFFISLVDSANNSWANGPLHAGGNGPTACLALDQTSPHAQTSIYAAIGAGIGGLVVGLILGLLVLCLPNWMLCAWCRRYQRPGIAVDTASEASYDGDQYGALPEFGGVRERRGHRTSGVLHRRGQESLGSTVVGSQLGRDSAYKIEPWMPPGSADSTTPQSPSGFTHVGAPLLHGTSPPAPSQSASPPPTERDDAMSVSVSGSGRPDSAAARSHVYVVHHDGGRAPVSVYTEDGTEVVELPPRYPDGTLMPAGAAAAAAPGTTTATGAAEKAGGPGRPRPSPVAQRRLPNAPRKVELRLENPSGDPDGPR